MDNKSEDPLSSYDNGTNNRLNFWESQRQFFDEEGLSRLISHLTGIETERTIDLIEKCTSDHHSIKAKYKLPVRRLRSDDPDLYLKELIQIAQGTNTQIITPEEDPDFLAYQKKHSIAGAAYNPEKNLIVCPGELSYLDGYRKEKGALRKAKQRRVGDLEHEIIHSQQKTLDPEMPIEKKEYEAYVGANFSPEYVREEDPAAIYGLFDAIKRSIDNWYVSREIDNPWKSRNQS